MNEEFRMNNINFLISLVLHEKRTISYKHTNYYTSISWLVLTLIPMFMFVFGTMENMKSLFFSSWGQVN